MKANRGKRERVCGREAGAAGFELTMPRTETDLCTPTSSRVARWWMAAGLAAAVLGAGVSKAQAQPEVVLQNVDFETADTGGWSINGSTERGFDIGNPGAFLLLPTIDTWGINFRVEDGENPLNGNLMRHGGVIRVAVDIRVFSLFNFFEQPMNPGDFPMALQLMNPGNPNDPLDDVSVYVVGFGMPTIDEGWVRYNFEIPVPQGGELPAGWGGTGAEDPTTFEPQLPAGWTYEQVIQNVQTAQITTIIPGFFYASAFWSVGFDNLTVSLVSGSPCPADYNTDGVLNTDDISDFVTDYFSVPPAARADFNSDGSINTDDLSDFITAYFSGC